MLRIAQNLSLQQKMAPQLIQSLQLLQMSTLELELKIKEEMELNPLLEENMELEEDTEEQEEIPESTLDEGLKEEEPLPKEEEVNWEGLLDDLSDQGSYNSEQAEYDPDWEGDREPRENRITTIPPLIEQLHEQLALTDLEGTDREIGGFLIGNIDEQGY